MSDIFISYASEDRERILPLVKALEKIGWSAFWDRTIPISKTWQQVIGEEINQCKCMIVAWSSTSVLSEWVYEEAGEGKRRHILFPVLIDEALPPIGFRSIQAGDLTGWDGKEDSTALDRLVRDLSQVLGKPLAEIQAKHKAAENEERRRDEEVKRNEEEERQRQDEKEGESKGIDAEAKHKKEQAKREHKLTEQRSREAEQKKQDELEEARRKQEQERVEAEATKRLKVQQEAQHRKETQKEQQELLRKQTEQQARTIEVERQRALEEDSRPQGKMQIRIDEQREAVYRGAKQVLIRPVLAIFGASIIWSIIAYLLIILLNSVLVKLDIGPTREEIFVGLNMILQGVVVFIIYLGIGGIISTLGFYVTSTPFRMKFVLLNIFGWIIFPIFSISIVFATKFESESVAIFYEKLMLVIDDRNTMGITDLFIAGNPLLWGFLFGVAGALTSCKLAKSLGINISLGQTIVTTLLSGLISILVLISGLLFSTYNLLLLDYLI